MVGIKHDCNTNNLSESFNSWIGPARSKHVVDLIDMIKAMIMEQRASRKISSIGWQGIVVPYVEEYIREVTTRKEQFIIRQSTMFKAEVEGLHKREEVDIEARECTCKVWQLTGLPCIHAAAFIGLKKHSLWHVYVDEHYHVNRYLMAYEGAISTMPTKEQWELCGDGVQIDVPNSSRPRGRPRKNRMKSFLEKSKRLHKCSRCGLQRHHRSTCKNSLTQVTGSDQASCQCLKLPFRQEPLEEDQHEDPQFVTEDEFAFVIG